MKTREKHFFVVAQRKSILLENVAFPCLLQPPSLVRKEAYIRNCVVYTGTHDNETLIGWWSSIDQRSRDMARDYMAAHYTPDRLINVPFITLAMRSIADLCIIPMQDYLGLDNKSRMNKPSTVGDNWRWRMISDDTDDDLAEEIGRLTLMTGRSKM